MKILVTMYGINSPGGIINHNENLISGFKMQGHHVDFIELVWRTEVKAKTTKSQDGYEMRASDIPVHQGKGWLFPKKNRFPYKGDYNLRRWKQYVAEYDVIIWQIPVPTKQRDNEGNVDWLQLYDLPDRIKQIAVIHDGNMEKSYPWISQISHHLNGLACVHPCAYHGAAVLNVPRALIFNPQSLKDVDDKPSWSSRKDGFISMQTFKGWKHVDDLVRAIPHLSPNIEKLMAGGGIEHNYMTSKDKCKENYFVNSEKDPDISDLHHGRKIWDVALGHGMQWFGYLSEAVIREKLRTVKCVIDPSWSVAYAKVGDHFNRVVVDGIIEGTIPIARNYGISTNEEGIGEVFKPYENYIMVSHDASPLEFAKVIEKTIYMDEGLVSDIQENNRQLLNHFEKERVGLQFLSLANGHPTGFYGKLEVGTVSDKVKTKTQEIMTDFFKLTNET